MEPPERERSGVREPGQWRYWAYRLAAAVVPRIPYAVSAPLAMAVGLGMWAASPAARQRVAANLARVPALAADSRARAAAVRGVFRHLALNYVDLFRAQHLPESRIQHDWQLDGGEHFDAALRAGRGVILITGHLGNFDYAAARLGIFGTPITIPVERLKPERLFDLACQLRTHHGVRAVPADSREGLRALFAALRRGEAVLLTVDRDVVGSGVTLPLFGAPARLPTGAALLAQRSGAPLLWASGWREGLRRSHGAFTPLAIPPDAPSGAPSAESPGPARRAITSLLVPIARELEHQIAAHPEQWVAALTRIWSDPSDCAEDPHSTSVE